MKTAVVLCVFIALVAAVSIKIDDVDLGDACGRPCANNNGCDAGGKCSWCDPSDGFCKQGLDCGEACNTDSDCNQLEECHICPKGYCTSTGLCNEYCTDSTDCGSTCGLCEDNKCKASCDSVCTEDLDCQFEGSNCTKCINQKCQAGGCFAECSQDADCQREGNCTHCINNRCSSTCGGHCTKTSECSGDFSGCGLCNDEGICATGQCGSPCGVGNNGGCLGDPKCTYCNATSATCTVGLPCYSKCTVNTDCDQTGGCKLCSAHGYCVGTAEFKASAERLRRERAQNP